MPSSRRSQVMVVLFLIREVSTFAPTDDAPVPDEYRLGVGDQLVVQLFGKENATIHFQLVVTEISTSQNSVRLLCRASPLRTRGHLLIRESSSLLVWRRLLRWVVLGRLVFSWRVRFACRGLFGERVDHHDAGAFSGRRCH